MPPLPRFLIFFALVVLGGCATPQSRIAAHQAAYDNYPIEARRKIAAGQVEVGFTPDMVRLALGEPDRQFARKTAAGEVEVWGYRDHRPQFSFGLGFGSAGRHSAVGGAVETSTGGDDPEARVRIEFQAGKVTAIEYRQG